VSTSTVPVLDVTAPTFGFGSAEVAAARAASWYAQTPVGVAVLRYAEMQELLRDRRFIQSGQHWLESNGINSGPVYDWFVSSIVHLSGDDHRRLRQLTAPSFAPRTMDRIRPFVRRTAQTLAAQLAAQPGGDAMELFVDRLPLAVTCHLLGVSDSDLDMINQWTRDIGLIYSLASEPTVYQRVKAAVVGITDWTSEMLAERDFEGAVGDDLISVLLQVRRASGNISMDELRNLVVSMVFAGHDTTRLQLGRALALLCDHPDQWSLLSRRPELAPNAVEEIMRWAPAAPAIYRFATEDVEYQGLELPAGTFVMLCGESAQRDPRVYADGDTFDISRVREASQMTFGAGPHFCLGAPVARLEMAEALVALTSRLGPPALAGPVEWRSPLGIYGPLMLPLRFG
jgi:cytochrome P450